MVVISFLITIMVLCAILKLIALPFKIIIKFIINSIVAGILLAILAYFGIVVVLNAWIIILTGLLGIPGLVIGLIISMFI